MKRYIIFFFFLFETFLFCKVTPFLCTFSKGKNVFSFYTNVYSTSDIWLDLESGFFLPAYVSVKTGENSHCDIVISKKSKVQIGEKSLLTITYEYDHDNNFLVTITIINGLVHGAFREDAQHLKHLYILPNCYVEAYNGRVYIDYKSKKNNAVIGSLASTMRIRPIIKPEGSWAKFMLEERYKVTVTDKKGRIRKFTKDEAKKTWRYTFPAPVYKHKSMLEDKTQW
ncbi:hypothetical protein ACFL6D_02440 [Spirochaetota bacterium]